MKDHGYSFLLGWLLLRPRHLEGIGPLVPQPLLSASDCLCDVRPSSDDWAAEEDLSSFVLQHQLPVDCNIIFFAGRAIAQEMNERWLNGEYRPIALALRPDSVGRFDQRLQSLATSANSHNPDYHYEPLKAQAFVGNERLLGFEVLSYNWGWHSYLCCYLEKELFEFGGELNSLGLITDGDLAGRFAEACNANQWGEPGLNLAYAFFAAD